MNLGDFETSGLKVEDFNLTPKGVKLESTTTAQVAGAVSLADPKQMDVASFRMMRENLQNIDGRADFVNSYMTANSVANYYKNNIDAVLVDPELDDNQKRVVVDMIKGRIPDQPRSTLLTLAQNLSMTDEDINPEEEDVLLKALDLMDTTIRSKQDIQSMINAWKIENDPGALGQLVDMGELFVPFAEAIQIKQLAKEFDVGYDEAWLTGTTKQQLFEIYKQVPISERAEFTQRVLDVIENNPTLIGSDGNYLHAIDTLEKMVGSGDYSDVEKWIDNTIDVLDVIGAGFLVRLGVKGARSAKLGDMVLDAGKAKVHSDVAPSSPSQVVKEVSPQNARAIHAETVADESGEVAEAMYGTNRTEALAKDKLPEPEITEGAVPNKINMEKGAQFPEPENIKLQRTRDARTYLPEGQRVRPQEEVVQSVERVEGFVHQPQMMTVKTLDNGNNLYNIMFRPLNAGWKTADQALDAALYALRDFGARAEDITLYRKNAKGQYIETTPKLLAARKALRDEYSRKKKAIPNDLKEIDYAVGLKYEDDLNVGDITASEPWVIKRNIFDRFNFFKGRNNQGSLHQHVLDPASSLDPSITRPASALTDSGYHLRKLYVDLFKEKFLKPHNSLPKDRQNMMDDYIKEANLNEIPFDQIDLRARGFNTKEIEILEGWRRANDALWHAANSDMAKSLRARGYQVYTDTHGTHLIAKPYKRNAVSERVSFYNSQTNTVEKMTKQELDDFYQKGGTLAKTSEPVYTGSGYIDFIKVVGNPNGGYLRAMRSDEVVLHYRQGYYPTMYEANFFVDKKITLPDGRVEIKTVSTARTADEARRAERQLQASARPGEEFKARLDRSNYEGQEMNENSWNIAVSSGMSNQKIRGKRLTDAGSDLWKAGHTNLVDPLEAIARQIGSLSERVMMRDYFEAVKKRWVDQYFDALRLDKDKYGQKYFPKNVDEIKKLPSVSGKVAADARTTYNYIQGLENGWVNSVDDAWKATFNFIADTMIDGKSPILEGWTRDAARGSPTSVAKGAAFKLYLAANPIRQLVIQGHQSVQLFALDPVYMLGGLQRDWFRVLAAGMGRTKDAEAVEMWKELERSGLREAIDANNLVRQSSLRLRNSTGTQKVRGAMNLPFEIGQRVGFDVGERTVLLTSWMMQRHLKVKQKGTKVLTRADYEEIHGKARAFTYDMNRAGDMPYNQNSLAVIAQFLQVPHKAVLQPLFNRSLSRQERAQLLAWNTVVYGVPTGGIFGTWFYNNVPEGATRDALEFGLEDILLNYVASAVTGEKQSINWGDLAPVNSYGLYETMHGLWTGTALDIVAGAPAGALLFGNNPRLTNAFKTTARWIVPAWNYEDPNLTVKYTDVGIAFANLMSGASNAFKGAYALESRKFVSSLGNVTDEDVTKHEAIMKGLVGLRTHAETGNQEVMQRIYKGQTKLFTTNDVNIWYTELKRTLTRRGMSPSETEIAQMILSEGYRVFGLDKPEFRLQLGRLIKNDVERNGTNIYLEVAKRAGIQNVEEVRTLINMLPKNETRDSINMWLDKLDEQYDKLKERAKEEL